MGRATNDGRGGERGGGYAVTLFSSIDAAPPATWDELARGQSLLLQRDFLRAREQGATEAGDDPTASRRYALLSSAGRGVGVACFTLADFAGPAIGPLLADAPTPVGFVARQLSLLQRDVRVRVLVCGDPCTSGEHGFVLSPGVVPELAARALLAAAERAATDLGAEAPAAGLLFKDFGRAGRRIAEPLSGQGFAGLETEPNMVLELDADWLSFTDYLGSLSSKFRVKARRAYAKSSALVLRELGAEELQELQPRLEELHEAVLGRASYRLGGMSMAALPALRRALGGALVAFGCFLDERLVGFATGLVDRGTLEAQHVGFDYSLNRDHSIYPRMLYGYLEVAIARRLAAVNYGRTASEIKSTLGAVPVPTICYVRHRRPAFNRLLAVVARSLRMPAFAQRRPFTVAWYQAHGLGGRGAALAAG